MSILLGDDAGDFSTPIRFFLGDFTEPRSLAVGDFNGDGKQDLAIAEFGINGHVSVLLRECQSQIAPAETACSQFSSGAAEALAACNTILTTG